MNPPLWFLLFGGGFCLSLIITCIVGAYREKDKSYYFGALGAFLMLLAVVSVFLPQPVLALIFLASAALVAIASLPSLRKFQTRKTKEWMAKYGQEVDLSAPLRLRDLFTTRTGWLRFVYRWGVGKYVFFWWFLMTPILGGGLLVLSLWLKVMSIGFAINYTFAFSICTAIMTYFTLKSALKEKPSEVARVPTAYRSLNAEGLYRKLLDMYIRVWGSRLGAIRELENNIQSCMKQGLNREDAIRKIAAWEFEGIPREA